MKILKLWRIIVKGFSPVEAVAEYIWNGYDANATIVNVQIDANSIPHITSNVVYTVLETVREDGAQDC